MKSIIRMTTLLLLFALVFSLVACDNREGEADKESESGSMSETETATNSESETETETESETAPSSLNIALEDWPVIDGATALAPYYEAMASKLLGMTVEEAKQYVLCNKTDGAYENLTAKEADMIFCALPSDEQIESARKVGVEFEYTEILNGGFVFFVNKNNPIESLTIEQLHDIYSGKITNWQEVGGNDEDIVPYQRSEGSGSQTGIYRFVIGKDEIMEAPSGYMIGEMSTIVDAVANYENSENAIGYSYYYYVANMHYSDDIKLVKIDGIEPSDETIANGSYPMINKSYVINRADEPETSIVRQIIAWIISDEGQKTGEEAGYIRNRIY